jgi:hypothetical protein
VPSSGKELIMNCVTIFIVQHFMKRIFINVLNQLKSVYDCLSTPMLAKCLAHIIVLDSINLKPCCEEQKFATSHRSLYLSRPANVASLLPSCNPQSTGTKPEFVSLRLWEIRVQLTTTRFTTSIQEPFSS